MTGPSGLLDALAVVMIATAVYCAGRLVCAWLLRRPVEHDVDALHLMMGIAMAGMLLSSLSIFTKHVWEVVFAVACVWFFIRMMMQARDRSVHHLPHLVACVAMLYMYLAPQGIMAYSSSMPGMSDASSVRYPTLALVIIGFLIIYAVSLTDRTGLVSVSSGGGHRGQIIATPSLGTRRLLAPRSADCCHIVMSITMAYMLISML